MVYTLLVYIHVCQSKNNAFMFTYIYFVHIFIHIYLFIFDISHILHITYSYAYIIFNYNLVTIQTKPIVLSVLYAKGTIKKKMWNPHFLLSNTTNNYDTTIIPKYKTKHINIKTQYYSRFGDGKFLPPGCGPLVQQY